MTEVALITVQAWRHVPSHFDMATPFDSLIARVLAAGGAVLVAVIAAWFLSRAGWPERRRVQVVALAIAGYGVLCVEAVVESVAAIDPLAGSLAGSLVAAFGVVTLGVAGLLVLAGLVRSRPAAALICCRRADAAAQSADRGSPR